MTYFEWEQDSFAREQAQDKWDRMQDAEPLDVEPQDVESDLEMARRLPAVTFARSTPDERCCDNPQNFRPVNDLSRDPHTGYVVGTYYVCEHCGTRICEEDYASLAQWIADRDRLKDQMEKARVLQFPTRKWVA